MIGIECDDILESANKNIFHLKKKNKKKPKNISITSNIVAHKTEIFNPLW